MEIWRNVRKTHIHRTRHQGILIVGQPQRQNSLRKKCKIYREREREEPDNERRIDVPIRTTYDKTDDIEKETEEKVAIAGKEWETAINK